MQGAIVTRQACRAFRGHIAEPLRAHYNVSRAGGRRIYAAGGVRDRADMIALHAAGAAGVLVATALHAGTIKAGDLEEIAGL